MVQRASDQHFVSLVWETLAFCRAQHSTAASEGTFSCGPWGGYGLRGAAT